MTGQTVSHYRILEKLGEGGMGVVYRAEDTKLGRTVALKFLPPQMLEEPDSKARLLREARAAAVLNHPNICTVYEIDHEHGFLAMECVEGQSLKEKIAARPLKLEEALDIGIQIGQGLQAAHEKGIVHRDIKPGNIMVTGKGQVKITDFGLAQLGDRTRITKTGSTVGTPAYMSPEQAQGKETDRRADIWSFGVVLYEMISGRLPFGGDTEAAVARAILDDEPEPLTALRSRVPLELDRVVSKALAKGPGERYQHVEEMLVDLAAIRKRLESGTQTAAPRAVRRETRWPYLGAAAVMLAAVVTLFAVRLWRQPGAPERSNWAQVTHFPDSVTWPALSPDGRMLAFVRGPNTFFGPGEVYVKILPDGQPVQLTRDGMSKMSPVFSPDGSRIAYTVVDRNFTWDTWIVRVLGGGAQLWLPNASGLVWIGKDRLLFSEIKKGIHMAIVTSLESRAEARDVFVPQHERGMAHVSYPSPDGDWVLLAEMDNTGWLPCRVVPFDGSNSGRRVGPNGRCTSAAWSPDGAWMYFTNDAGGAYHIWRQRFPDGQSEQITAGPTEEEGIAVEPSGRVLLTAAGVRHTSIRVHDSQGDRDLALEGDSWLATSVSRGLPRPFSPDGRKLYYLEWRGPASLFRGGELSVANLESGQSERLLPGFPIAGYDISRDGKQVVFAAGDDSGQPRIWLASLDRRTPPRLLPPPQGDSPHFGADNDVFFRATEGKQNFLYRIRLDSGESQKVRQQPIISFSTVSPGGEWLIVSEASEDSHPTSQVVAIPSRGGSAVPICRACSVTWPDDGQSILIGFGHMGAGETRVIALPPGRLLPPLPPAGIQSEEDFASLPVRSVIPDRLVIPGPTASVYAYTRETVQRNIFRVPLP